MLQVHRAITVTGVAIATLFVAGCQGKVGSDSDSDTSVLQAQCIEVCDEGFADCETDEGCEEKRDFCQIACVEPDDDPCSCEAELDACLGFGDIPPPTCTEDGNCPQPGCEGGVCGDELPCEGGNCPGGLFDCDGDGVAESGECTNDESDCDGDGMGGDCPENPTCPDGENCGVPCDETAEGCAPEPTCEDDSGKDCHEMLCYARYDECQATCSANEPPCVSCIDQFQDCAWEGDFDKEKLLDCADNLYQCVETCAPLPEPPVCDCVPTDCQGDGTECNIDPDACPMECWGGEPPSCEVCEVVMQDCQNEDGSENPNDGCVEEVKICWNTCQTQPGEPSVCDELAQKCEQETDDGEMACEVYHQECLDEAN